MPVVIAAGPWQRAHRAGSVDLSAAGRCALGTGGGTDDRRQVIGCGPIAARRRILAVTPGCAGPVGQYRQAGSAAMVGWQQPST